MLKIEILESDISVDLSRQIESFLKQHDISQYKIYYSTCNANKEVIHYSVLIEYHQEE